MEKAFVQYVGMMAFLDAVKKIIGWICVPWTTFDENGH